MLSFWFRCLLYWRVRLILKTSNFSFSDLAATSAAHSYGSPLAVCFCRAVHHVWSWFARSSTVYFTVNLFKILHLFYFLISKFLSNCFFPVESALFSDVEDLRLMQLLNVIKWNADSLNGISVEQLPKSLVDKFGERSVRQRLRFLIQNQHLLR